MAGKLASWLGLGSRKPVSPHGPYRDDATNLIYNLLFCDDLELYRRNHHGPVGGAWKVLFADPPDRAGLEALALASGEETRLRILAFNALGNDAPLRQRKELLGIIVEVGLPGGLDTLAAYRDGGARYINQSGKMIIWEGDEAQIDEKIRQLFAAAERVVASIGPWDKPRLPPPSNGVARMTFLVSDGLYFGQGPMSALQQDARGAPVLASATGLLVALTERAQRR